MYLSKHTSVKKLTLLPRIFTSAVKSQERTSTDDMEDEGTWTVVLPVKIQAHSMKKAGVNELVDSLDFHTFLFRCGWMVRNLHTAFDYIFNNEKKDSVCGKVLAGWKLVGSNGERHGGNPCKSRMNHEPAMFDLFVTNLFFGHKDLKSDVQKILCTSVLQFIRGTKRRAPQVHNK